MIAAYVNCGNLLAYLRQNAYESGNVFVKDCDNIEKTNPKKLYGLHRD
jgi:hypothetical protein